MKLRAALLGLVLAVAVGVGDSQATVSNITVTLDEASAYAYVSGATVYYSANSGSFTATVDADSDAVGGITGVDFPDVFGSGTATDNTAPYQNTYSFTSSDTDSGPQTVTVTDADGSVDGQFTVTPDTTAPTGQSVALSGGPNYGTLSVPLTLDVGTDAGAGVDSASGIVERASATLSGGTCGSFGSYATVTLVGGADTTVTSGNCYRYRYTISDLVGNQSAPSSASADAHVDAAVPVVTDTAPTEVTGAGDQYWNPSADTLWFRPAAGGSFTLNATATDADSGITQVAFPDVSSLTGWSGSTGGVDNVSPYSSPVAYTWTAGAAAPGAKQVIATNGTGVTGSDTITINADSTPPSGQTVVLGGGPWYATTPVPLTVGQGTDAGAGVDTSRSVVERAAAPLTNGACGTFGAFAAVTLSGGADTGVSTGNCYRYQSKATDNVGNVSTPSTPSADAKVDTTAPTTPSLLFTGFSNAASSGNVVYYRPTGAGSFTVSAASSDAESGVGSYAFPTLAGFTAAGSGPRRTYSFSNVGRAPAGPLAITATNRAGLSSSTSFTLVGDGTAPILTVRCNGKPCLATTYPKAVTVTATAADGSGSGLDTIRYSIDGRDPTPDRGIEYVRGFTVRTLTRLRVRAYDKAGNASRPAVLTIRSAADRLVFAAPPRLTARTGSRYLMVKVTSTRRALVAAKMTGPRLEHGKRWRFILTAGRSIVRFQLPAALSGSGLYRLVWTVQAGTQKTTKTTRVVFRAPKA